MGLELAPPVFLQSCLRVHLGRPSAPPPIDSRAPTLQPSLPFHQGRSAFIYFTFGAPLDTVQRKSSVVKRYVTPPLYVTGDHLKGTWDFRG